MIIPSDAVLHTAEILSLRHAAPSTYRQVARLYTAYLRGIDRLPPTGVVDAQYLYNELERGRVTALAINCNRYLRLVGLATGALIKYSDAVLFCADMELVGVKCSSDAKLASARRELMRHACLRYITDHHLIYDLTSRAGSRRKALWRSPCGTTITHYELHGERLMRS